MLSKFQLYAVNPWGSTSWRIMLFNRLCSSFGFWYSSNCKPVLTRKDRQTHIWVETAVGVFVEELQKDGIMGALLLYDLPPLPKKSALFATLLLGCDQMVSIICPWWRWRWYCSSCRNRSRSWPDTCLKGLEVALNLHCLVFLSYWAKHCSFTNVVTWK